MVVFLLSGITGEIHIDYFFFLNKILRHVSTAEYLLNSTVIISVLKIKIKSK